MIDESALIKLGYLRTEIPDRDCTDDSFDNLLFVDYKKQINKECCVCISYAYHADEPGAFDCMNNTATLEVGTKDLRLPLDIEKIEDLFKTLTIMI